ncbi:hypothetical protein WCE39_08035 [Luteimonas sp. MJ174]|uniref:hypothetical protein n=1 Tax=Luteimonas sp. MJ174 TaxID=3129237 RepID=UPI0031BB4D43
MTAAASLDLTKVSSDDLRAELARRQAAAKAKGKPMKHAKKSDWARARAVELRANLAEVRGGYQTGHRGHRDKSAQERTLEAEIQKFDRLAAKYEREGI